MSTSTSMGVHIWNDKDESRLFRIGAYAPMPPGYKQKKCPKCGSSSVIAVIILDENGSRAIESSDESDPEILCRSCGFWWDQ